MTASWAYHIRVQSVLRIALVLFLAGVVEAQINGPRASVTSLGGQFTIFNPPGPRASVTSLGPNGWGRGFCCKFGSPLANRGFKFHHHHRGVGFGFGGFPVYVMPYYYPADVIEPVDDSMEQSYAPGPTIFDRRGSTRRNAVYDQQLDERLGRIEQQLDEIEGAKPTQPAAQAATQAEPAVPEREQPDTVLVFHDGHTIQVRNYAIVGDTLYEYSGGRQHKIALADLDLSATEKQNDERGVNFRLPSSVSAN